MTGTPGLAPDTPRLVDLYPPWGRRRLDRLAPGLEARPYELFGVRPLQRTIGAEITGVDLSGPLDPNIADEVHRALLEWKVLVFVGQHVGPPDVEAFGRLWGEPIDATLMQTGSNGVDVLYVKGDQNYWHADDTFMAAPGIGSVLHIAEVPAIGGDTVFADMAAAYDNLDDGTKALIDDLQAVHDCAPYAAVAPHYRDHLAEITERFPPVQHPVVRTHPETGRKTLFVNAMWTTRILGLDEGVAGPLLLRLCLQATVPEYQCRVRWSVDKVVMWDNRAVQHYAVSDYDDPRLMVRTSMGGDRPF